MRIFWHSMRVYLASVRDSSYQVIISMINYPSWLISVFQTRRRLLGILSFLWYIYYVLSSSVPHIGEVRTNSECPLFIFIPVCWRPPASRHSHPIQCRHAHICWIKCTSQSIIWYKTGGNKYHSGNEKSAEHHAWDDLNQPRIGRQSPRFRCRCQRSDNPEQSAIREWSGCLPQVRNCGGSSTG